MKRPAGALVGILSLAALSAASPAATAQIALSDAALIATNSAQLNRDAEVTGSVVVNAPSVAPTLAPGVDLEVEQGVVAGDLYAYSMELARGLVINGDLYVTELQDFGASYGQVFPYGDPVFATLPEFRVAVPPTGGDNCQVGGDCQVSFGEAVVLDEGAYGVLTVEAGASLDLAGGGYDFVSVNIAANARVAIQAPSEIRVAGAFYLGQASYLGFPDGPPCSVGRDVEIQVGASSALSGPGAIPPAVWLNKGSTACANFYAPEGTFWLGRDAHLTGGAIAKDIRIDRGAQVVLDSAFNLPPVADPQTVFTGGVDPIDIVLTGSDPEGDPLTFTIVSGPSAGIVSGPFDETATSATVTYDATTEGANDRFIFQVDDGKGGIATAAVDINPDDTPLDPPPVDQIVAQSQTLESVTNEPLSIVLKANAPADFGDLTFSITGGPSSGTVTTPSPIAPPLGPVRSAAVTYTPGQDYTGPDSFSFQACADTGCSNQATVSIFIQDATPPEPPVVLPLEASTEVDEPVTISLAGIPGAETGGGDNPHDDPPVTGGVASAQPIAFQAPVSIDAVVAWNVADATGDGLGDESNAGGTGFPATPGLISAAVGSVGGPGSNGTTRIHIEFDIANLSGQVNSATVILATLQGSNDSVDTFFFAGNASGNGSLENSDFESPATELDGVVMPVTGQPNDAGTFTFDVSSQLQAAIDAGFSHFVIQGRVDEALQGNARGLQVRSACATCAGADPPTLTVTIGEPNLTITEFSAPSCAEHGEVVGDRIAVTLTNTGDAAIPAGTLSSIGFYVSADAAVPTSDTLLTGGRENLASKAPNGLAPGESISDFLFAGASINSASPTGDVYIGVVADEFDTVAESNELDNTAVQPIEIRQAGGDCNEPGEEPATLFYVVTSLPLNGTLLDSFSNPVVVGQALPSPDVTYQSNTGFAGTDTFSYQAVQGTLVSNIADVGIRVVNLFACVDCVTLTVQLLGAGAGDVAFDPPAPKVGASSLTYACSSEEGSCTLQYEPGTSVLLIARPVGAFSYFSGWGGACSGTSSTEVVNVNADTTCTATFALQLQQP